MGSTHTDIYQIAKCCRTCVEIIEKYYAANMKKTWPRLNIGGHFAQWEHVPVRPQLALCGSNRLSPAELKRTYLIGRRVSYWFEVLP